MAAASADGVVGAADGIVLSSGLLRKQELFTDRTTPSAKRGHPSFSKEGNSESEGVVVTESELIDFCKEHLADFKCPKTIHFVDDIPKGPTGKLLKRELTNLFALHARFPL